MFVTLHGPKLTLNTAQWNANMAHEDDIAKNQHKAFHENNHSTRAA